MLISNRIRSFSMAFWNSLVQKKQPKLYRTCHNHTQPTKRHTALLSSQMMDPKHCSRQHNVNIPIFVRQSAASNGMPKRVHDTTGEMNVRAYESYANRNDVRVHAHRAYPNGRFFPFIRRLSAMMDAQPRR